MVYLNDIELKDMTEELKVSRDIIIAYFISYAGNEFIDAKKLYYPKCKNLNHEHLNVSVIQLSKHMLDKGLKTLNEYASLGWMYNLLAKNADTYEDAIRCYYFAVCTCRDVDESQSDRIISNYYQDFWSNDLKILSRETVGSRGNRRLQRAYIEL